MGSCQSTPRTPFIITKSNEVRVYVGGRYRMIGKCDSLKESQLLIAKYLRDPGASNVR